MEIHESITIPGLKLLRPIAWEEIEQEWQRNERTREWNEFLKQRGYRDWKEWRSDRWTMLRLPERTWELYAIHDPLNTVPQFHGGPFLSWLPYYGGKISASFTEIVAQANHHSSAKIRSVLDHFPMQTMLVGLKRGEQVFIYEGMHRCSALTLAALEGREMNVDVTMAIAEIEDVSDELLREVAGRTNKLNS
jgi:hypothetical protein